MANLLDSKLNDVLTEGFQYPEMLPTPAFVQAYPNLISTFSTKDNVNTEAPSRQLEALVVKTQLDKFKMTVIFLVVLFIACVVGAIVGAETGSLDVGVAVAVGIFGLMTVLQALIAWY